jgi:hypothetical protein
VDSTDKCINDFSGFNITPPLNQQVKYTCDLIFTLKSQPRLKANICEEDLLVKISIAPAATEQMPVIQNMARFYAYDLSKSCNQME